MSVEQKLIRFPAMGGNVTIYARGTGSEIAATGAEEGIREVQEHLTRFESDSELSRLNRDERTAIPASPVMLRLAAAVGYAGHLSRGLVDATLLDEVERAGYTRSLTDSGPGSAEMVTDSDDNRNDELTAHPGDRWRSVKVDRETGSVLRPVGVRVDSGGLGKGMAADIGAEMLEHLEHFSVECSGDLRFGGSAGEIREIEVSSPFEGSEPVARLRLDKGAVATSGITRRAWRNPDGSGSHHLIDPRTGKPAATGVTQVTAVAPTALEAEVRAKSALLSGPEGAGRWLIHGGVVVLDEGQVQAFGDFVDSGARA